MSELVAGIIHEMRNPLSIAMGQCNLLRDEEEFGTVTMERINKIEASIGRAVKVARNFLDFSRTTGNEPVPTDINGVIKQTAELLDYEFRNAGVSISLKLEQLPLVKVDAGSVQQVLLNILKNAQQAASEVKPRGTVSVRSFHDPQKSLVRIELTDTGSGIPANARSHIFEPFFTTKARGVGTGLGLAVSKRLIEHHNGTLSFTSKSGKGTTFVIEIPVGEATSSLLSDPAV
jgi:signal transduction histidine kinase